MDTDTIEFGTFTKLECVFSIKRSTAYKLLEKGKIKSRYVRLPGSRSGVRLIDFNSVRELLNGAPEKPTKEILAVKKRGWKASVKKRAEKRAEANGTG